MDRVSSRDRIAGEVRPSEAEKKAPRVSRPKPAAPVRMKIIWEVWSGTGKVVKTFPYADKAAAEAQTRALVKSTGRKHALRPTKVPME